MSSEIQYSINVKAIDTSNKMTIDPDIQNGIDVLRKHLASHQTPIVEQPVSLLQRHLKLGYRDALTLLEKLIHDEAITRV